MEDNHFFGLPFQKILYIKRPKVGTSMFSVVQTSILVVFWTFFRMIYKSIIIYSVEVF